MHETLKAILNRVNSLKEKFTGHEENREALQDIEILAVLINELLVKGARDEQDNWQEKTRLLEDTLNNLEAEQKQKYSEFENILEAKEKALKEAEWQLEKAEKDISSIKQFYEEKTAILEENNKTLNNKMESLGKSYLEKDKTKERELGELAGKFKIFEEAVYRTTEENADLKALVARNNVEAEYLRDMLKTNTANNEKKIEELTQKAQSAVNSNETANKELAVLKESLQISTENYERQVEGLSKELAGNKNQNKNMEKELKELKDVELKRLNLEFERSENLNRELESRIRELKSGETRIIEDFEERIKNYKKEITELKYKYGRLNQDHLNLDEAVAMSRKKSAKLENNYWEFIKNTAHGFSHLFRNNLSIINSTVELCIFAMKKFDAKNNDAAKLHESLKTDLTAVTAEVKKMTKNIKTYVELSEMPDISLAGYSLAQVISGVINTNMDNITKQGIVINDYKSEFLEGCLGDKESIRVAFSEIILNAIEALPLGGKINLESSIFSEDKEDFVTIKITDSGAGIDESIHSKVLLPFFTTKQGRDGLGLSRAHKNIVLNRGSLLVEKNTGTGTTVVVTLLREKKNASDTNN